MVAEAVDDLCFCGRSSGDGDRDTVVGVEADPGAGADGDWFYTYGIVRSIEWAFPLG